MGTLLENEASTETEAILCFCVGSLAKADLILKPPVCDQKRSMAGVNQGCCEERIVQKPFLECVA